MRQVAIEGLVIIVGSFGLASILAGARWPSIIALGTLGVLGTLIIREE